MSNSQTLPGVEVIVGVSVVVGDSVGDVEGVAVKVCEGVGVGGLSTIRMVD